MRYKPKLVLEQFFISLVKAPCEAICDVETADLHGTPAKVEKSCAMVHHV